MIVQKTKKKRKHNGEKINKLIGTPETVTGSPPDSFFFSQSGEESWMIECAGGWEARTEKD